MTSKTNLIISQFLIITLVVSSLSSADAEPVQEGARKSSVSSTQQETSKILAEPPILKTATLVPRSKFRRSRVVRKVSKSAAIAVPGALVRYTRNSRGYGMFQDVIQFPIPGSLSVVTITTLRSRRGANGEADLVDASTNNYLFSPHFLNLGLVGYYSDASGVGNNTGRGGLYYKWSVKSLVVRGVALLMAFPIAERTDKGRGHALWAYSFLGRGSFSGSLTYIFKKNQSSFQMRPQLGFDLFKGLRAIVVYDHNDRLERAKGALEPGLELLATF